ncbi:MAG: 23S rRNA (pseudouridine(1915)-N(3))-methyltransferase RlmH [Gammaproteobacteria bacterium]|nr:23S rRNA (pseudouridine(1915)-N(3))-methyltransferase RlmH [Gammaproteobacteria bacterium]
MRVRLLAAGTRQPAWVREGYADYAGRLAAELRLELVEIPVARGRAAGSAARAVAAEARLMLEAIRRGDYVVALEVGGRAWSTPDLARWLGRRLAAGSDLALLIGGPDGLGPEVLARADERWSLSPLTLPHGLARVVVAEQLYRAASLLRGHPYHRA